MKSWTRIVRVSPRMLVWCVGVFAGQLAGLGLSTQPLDLTQDRPVTFRGRADLIQLDVSVVDRDRRPVTNLTAADFTVLENGKPRPIQAFAAVNLPPVPPPLPGWQTDTPPDVVTNQVSPGRVVVLLIDDASVSSGGAATSGTWAVSKVRETARTLIEELDPADLAAVVFTRDNRTAQSLTLDRRRLHTAIERSTIFPGSSTDDLSSAVAADAVDMRLDPASQTGDCPCGFCAFETLRQVAHSLGSVEDRRKDVLFVSAGWPLIPRSSCYLQQVRMLTETFRYAQEGNISIHPMDPVGLLTGAVQASGRASTNNLGIEFLRTIADHTGTRAVVNNNDPDRQVRRILDEARSYYLLGFEPADLTPDGKKRKIEVKVNRRNVEVRTRNGYYPPAPPAPVAAVPSRPLDHLIDRLMPDDGVPLELSLTPIVGSAGTELAVVVGVTHLGASGGTAVPDALEDIEVAARILDQYGRPRGIERRTVRVTPGRAGAGLRYELLSRLPIAPGRYEIRLGMHSRDRSGSVYGYVEVPNFAREAVSTTGWMLAADPAAVRAPRDLFADLLPVVPTTRRTFTAKDRVEGLLRIYRGSGVTAAPVSVETLVLDAAGAVKVRDVRTYSPDAFSASRYVDHRWPLPLSYGSGEYLLDAVVRSGDASARSAVRYRIE